MIGKYDHYLEYLEWEILEPEHQITSLSSKLGLYNLNKNCIIKFSRDGQYKLAATISGTVEDIDKLEPNIERESGTFIPKETVTGYSTNGRYKYIFYGVILGSIESTLPISPDSVEVNFRADFHFNKVIKSLVFNENTVAFIQEWYLTGYSNINFTESTLRSLDQSFKRSRRGIDPEEEISQLKSNSSERDCLEVKYSDTSFIVSKVPKEFGPNWSFNMAIEYRQSFGRIPDDNEREAISELVSFVFGNQFLKIGQTSYNEAMTSISEEYNNPWGDNVMSRCQRLALPPVQINDYNDWGRGAILLNELLIPYLEQRNKLCLKDVLWKYWIAKYSSIGANLPILSSAVETLAEKILKIHPEIKHYYIDFKEFVGTIAEELVSIEIKIDSNPNKGIILNKLKGATQRGSNEKLEMMFEIIQLTIGKIEKNALRARNKMAHSSFGEISDEDLREIVRLTKAYETLFNRIFLKILLHKGQYVDYYTIGYPNRDIDAPIPE